MLKIIAGPAESGQSRILCREMVAASRAQPLSYFIAIVPEQSTLRMQRQVVKEHPAHVVMNIDVVSFERLAYKVFAELGISQKEILNDTGKVLLLRKILEQNKEDLKVYKNKVHKTGFAEEIKSVITELRQYGIGDNELFLMQESAQEKGNSLLFDKLQDIRLLYRKFGEAISEKYTTQEDVLTALATRSGQSGIIRGAGIYLDGFTGFTPVQFKLIGELMKYCSDVTVSLSLPEEKMTAEVPDYDPFFLSSTTAVKLKELAEAAGQELSVIYASEGNQLPQAAVYQASDIYSELRFITGKILAGVKSGEHRFRDYAVILSDVESYHEILKNEFEEAGIACFIDYKTKLSDNALAGYVLSALQTVTGDFSAKSIFAWLKNTLSGMELFENDLLEDYCLEFGIRGAGKWNGEFKANRKQHSSSDKEEDIRYFWDLDQVNRIRQKAAAHIVPFYYQCRGKDKTAKDYSEALLELMEKDDIARKIEDLSKSFEHDGDLVHRKEYEQIYVLMEDLLRRIPELMGEEQISLRQYADILAGALEEIKVSIIPPSLDAVFVGDLTRSRPDDTQVLFMVGMNDGKMPAAPARTGLFTRNEREFLKENHFELAPTVLENICSQYYYFYLMAAKPKEWLYLTYPCADQGGRELTGSCLIGELQELLPGIQISEALPEEAVIWNEQLAGELAEHMRSAASFNEDAAQDPDPEDKKMLHYFLQKDKNTFEQIMAGTFYSNTALDLDKQTALDLYGERIKGSVSRFEKFYECPFKYFLNYGLTLEERREYQIKATDVGTMYHDSLERYSNKLREHGLTYRDVSDEESRALAMEAAEEAAQALDNDAFSSTQRNAYLLSRMQAVTLKTTDVLRKHVRDGNYDPELFEDAFYDRRTEVEFRGKIDRVDLYDGDDIFVKIIDYKSGNKKFDIMDIYTGVQLQLTVYMSEALKKLRQKYPDKNVRPGGIYYYLVNDRFVRTDKEKEEKYKMSGLTNIDRSALEAVDGAVEIPGSSAIVEYGYTKTGAMTASSNVADDTQFEHLMDFVEEKIDEAGRQIKSGNVNIRPVYISDARNACVYCDYRDVCKFEDGRWGSEYKRQTDEKKEVKEKIYG